MGYQATWSRTDYWSPRRGIDRGPEPDSRLVLVSGPEEGWISLSKWGVEISS